MLNIIAAALFIATCLFTAHAAPFTGNLKLLIIRCALADEQPDSVVLQKYPDNAIISAVNDADTFYLKNSWNRVGVSPIGSGSALVAGVNRIDITPDWYWQLYAKGIQLAQSQGYDYTTFNAVLILWNCSGEQGAQTHEYNRIYFHNYWRSDVLCHELRHSLLMIAGDPGYGEACLWKATNSIDPPPTGARWNYYDLLDIGGYTDWPTVKSLNAYSKTRLGWTSRVYALNNTVNGNIRTLRIAAIDGPSDNDDLYRAIRVMRNCWKTDRTDLDQEYWVELRQKYTTVKSLNNGVVLHWGPCSYSGNSTLLLDMSPYYKNKTWGYDETDVGLFVGKTLADTSAGVYTTPVELFNTSPKSAEVVVATGDFSTDKPPTARITCPSLRTFTNQPLTFNANGADPDNDSLAYFWDFGDSSDETRNSVLISHSWTKSGAYSVYVWVSDMKGRMAVAQQKINVDTPASTSSAPMATPGPGTPVICSIDGSAINLFVPGMVPVKVKIFDLSGKRIGFLENVIGNCRIPCRNAAHKGSALLQLYQRTKIVTLKMVLL